MAKPTDTYRISANSIEEIQTAWDETARAISKRAKARTGYVIPTGHVLNGLVLWFLDQSADERERIALEGVALYAQRRDKSIKPLPSKRAPDIRVNDDSQGEGNSNDRLAKAKGRPRLK